MIEKFSLLKINDKLLYHMNNNFEQFELLLYAKSMDGVEIYGNLDYFNKNDLILPNIIKIEDGNFNIDSCSFIKFPEIIIIEGGNINIENVNISTLPNMFVSNGEVDIRHMANLKIVDSIIEADEVRFTFCGLIEKINKNKIKTNNLDLSLISMDYKFV